MRSHSYMNMGEARYVVAPSLQVGTRGPGKLRYCNATCRLKYCWEKSISIGSRTRRHNKNNESCFIQLTVF